MNYEPVLRPQAYGIDIPGRCRCGDQHRARRSASLPQAIVFGPCARAAAGHLHSKHGVVVRRIDWRRLDSNLVPIGIQLLGHEHWKSGVNALPHFGVVDDHGHPIVGADADECVRRERLLLRVCDSISERKIETEEKTTARGGSGFYKIAPAEVENLAHFPPPAFICAAR